MSAIDHAARLRGGVYGLLVGDALGVPYEFHPASALPPKSVLAMTPPQSLPSGAPFRRAHEGVPPGTWSDDGAQALCLLVSLLEQGRLELNDFADRCVRWYHDAYMTPDGVVFDIGVQTSGALDAIRRGVPLSEAGRSDERGNGNGSLMRCLPLALWHQGSDLQLVADAQAQSIITHPHPRSQVCCAIYCLWARGLLNGIASEPAFAAAVATLRELYPADGPHLQELEFHIRPEEDAVIRGSGYVVDSLRAARHLLATEPTYEAVVRSAIALGEDTDTTACIAGGVAGVLYGDAQIPEEWLSELKGRALVDPLVESLLEATNPA